VSALAVAAAVWVPRTPSTGIILSDANGFTITSQLSSSPTSVVPASFYPGAQRYLVLAVNDPLTAAINVTSLSVSVTQAPAGCQASNLDLSNGSATFTESFSVQPGQTSSAWLPVSMLDTGADQDGCQGATFDFAYSGTAGYTEVYATSTAVTSSLIPSVVGQSVTYTATVTGIQGANQDPVPSSPTGTVTFDDGTSVICSNVAVTSASTTTATATCTSPVYNTSGTHPIEAIYSNSDGNFTASTSPAFSQVVNPSATTTTLTSAPNPSSFGQPVMLTAAVVPASGLAATGTVSFYTGTSTGAHSLLGTGQLNGLGGTASLSTSALAGGADSLYAVYAGSANDVGSTSVVITQTVTFTTACITGTIDGGYTVKSGHAVCFAAGSIVNGGITVQSGGALSVTGTTVNGGVASTGATALRVCGSTVNGGISASVSSGFVMIGDGGDDGPPGCAANTIDGNATLTNNSRGFEFAGDKVTGNVTLSGNTVTAPTGEDAAEVEGNAITGNLSCATSNNPALTDGGQRNTVTGTRTGQCSAAGF
jgi:hypothetical protein